MAHIANCLLEGDADRNSLRSYISRSISPAVSSSDSLDRLSQTSSATEEKPPFKWRMHQPETRKYQLFPKGNQLAPLTAGKQLDPEQAFALVLGQNGEKTDSKTSPAGGLRMRIKEHNLTRRRKVSVPELGPMTTVQEVAMDSPTIPGRPPLHERSISSPVNTWRQMNERELASSKLNLSDENNDPSPGEIERSSSATPRLPLSPKDLAPLVIPNQNDGIIPRMARQLSLSRLRAGNINEPVIRTARTDESPRTRTPYTPLSGSLTTPQSATTASTLPTPISAPVDTRYAPKPWNETTPVTTPQHNIPDPLSATPKADSEIPRSGTAMSHRRNVSESGSIMERGRPRKRLDGTPVGGPLKRSGSKRSKSAERRAFETLPKGWKPNEAKKMMEQNELYAVQKQALEQASRFEVLRKDEVESLSRELRHLDERTDYLRRTYTSLRAGRRNLHGRICQYLRSPRMAKFSQESMLKQEEALAELDASIDDWVGKLDQAENRRTRVRQKLLEHVAAAACIPAASDVVGVSESLQHAMGVRPNGSSATDISTPPRSPTKNNFLNLTSPSPSPQRVVARVPSAIIEQPGVEEAATAEPLPEANDSDLKTALQRMESIRIYADSDVYALLADVEIGFTKLGGDDSASIKTTELSDDQRKEVHRARSQELLNGKVASAPKNTDAPTPVSPPAPSPPSKDSPTTNEGLLLTAAVFRPGKAAAVSS